MSKDTLAPLKDAQTHATDTSDDLNAELHTLETAEEVDKGAIKALKAKIKTANTALKRAVTAVAKEEARIEREAEKEAKAEAAEEAKKAKAAEREASRMPEQNGIRRPKPATKCGQVWQLADELSAKFGQPTPVKDLLVAVVAAGLNEGNAKAEYARWRKFNGVTGRVSLPKEETKAA